MCSRRHEGGRVRSTTPEEDRYIVLSAKRNRRTTAQQVANQFLAQDVYIRLLEVRSFLCAGIQKMQDKNQDSVFANYVENGSIVERTK
ncbi:hypothetical protein TNCV_782521 [Trichonephila clavipes]|nr:hypothetical protein TNCV_782521 [Trichonephila clavipes]